MESGSTGAAAWGRQFLELVSDLVCVCKGGTIRYVNPAGAAVLGGKAADLIGRDLADFIHADFLDIFSIGLHELAKETEPFPLMFNRLDGSVAQVEVKARVLAEGEGAEVVVLQARDLTERTRAAEGILRSEDRYRTLVEQAMDLICVVTEGKISFINKAGVKMLGGGSTGDYLGRPIRDLVHADYKDIADSIGLLAEEEGIMPCKFTRADNSVMDAEITVMPFGGVGEDVFMMEARDITEHKKGAEDLRAREARLRGIMDAAGEGIITTSDRGVIQTFNPAAVSIFGYEAKEVIGQNISMLMPGDMAALHDGYMNNFKSTGQAVVLGMERELLGQRKDGTQFPLELNVTPVQVGTERLFTGIMRDITDRKKAEEAEQRYKEQLERDVLARTEDLQRLSRQNELILNSASDGIIGTDAQGSIVFSNPAAGRVLGWTDGGLVGRAAMEVLKQDNGMPIPVTGTLKEGYLKRQDGSTFPTEFANTPITDAGASMGSVLVFRDITRRKEAEDKLRLAGTVFETANEGIIVCDGDRIVTAVNPAFTTVTGHGGPEVIGSPPDFLAIDEDGKVVLDEMWGQVGETGHWDTDVWSKRADGEDYAVHVSITGIGDEDGIIDQYVLMISDITERKRDEERIRYQANYDALTGLPNRSLFNDRLFQAVMSSSRGGMAMGLMFIDLDGFKAVNDNLGHDMGDYLLKEAAKRISLCVRQYDTVARLGGDEFTVVMPNLETSRNAAVVAQRILESLAEPFVWQDKEGHVSGSIGIAVFPEDAPDADSLLQAADAAMYRAKAHGKANYQFFTTDLNDEVKRRSSLKDELAGALERNEYSLMYHPRIDVAEGHIVGVEALLRWNSPKLGSVEPNKFIPVLEEAGLMEAVGHWVLEQACAQQKAWQDDGYVRINVAINLSVRQLRQPGFAQTLKEVIDLSGANPARLELEITEEMLIRDAESCITTLMELRELGVKLAMDDFGIGYSSLNYLRRFPVHSIKIDNTFVQGITHGGDDLEMVAAIINMGHGLGRRIVAEGVETSEQLAILRRLDCDEAQGFLISRPVTGEEITPKLAKGFWEDQAVAV